MEDKVFVAVLLFWIVMNWILAACEGRDLSDVCKEKCNVTVDRRKEITTNVRHLCFL